MNDVGKYMDFDVCTDLKNPKDKYNVKIELANSITDNTTRELVICWAGNVVRNNFKEVYGNVLKDETLADVIKETTNNIMKTRNPECMISNIKISRTNKKSR